MSMASEVKPEEVQQIVGASPSPRALLPPFAAKPVAPLADTAPLGELSAAVPANPDSLSGTGDTGDTLFYSLPSRSQEPIAVPQPCTEAAEVLPLQSGYGAGTTKPSTEPPPLPDATGSEGSIATDEALGLAPATGSLEMMPRPVTAAPACSPRPSPRPSPRQAASPSAVTIGTDDLRGSPAAGPGTPEAAVACTSSAGTQASSSTSKVACTGATAMKTEPIGPPESLETANVYKLYRGTIGQIDEEHLRIWVEFPALQLCWAGYDLPARPYDRISLLDLTSCQCDTFDHVPSQLPCSSEWTRVLISADTSAGTTHLAGDGKPPQSRTLSIIGPPGTLQEFGEALQQLLHSREVEGQRGLEFIQKRLFQYLWKHRDSTKYNSKEEHLEAQAVLAFNLEPKEGVAYLKSKLNKKTEQDVGEWIALMSTQKGGLDPTLLGNYFSRRDTLEIFRAFVRCLDFRCSDIVVALRKLFDTFKPGGEGQVITRILEYFAEAYFDQWQSTKDSTEPRVAYDNPDSVLSVAVSLIMLNTGLHVATKKVGKRANAAPMTPEQYISNTRGVVTQAEASDQALLVWYEAVKAEEISVEPLPRAPFSKLPVQPDIEGWLIAVLGSQTQHRFWAVLALRRLYLFSDASEVEPSDAIDLKDVVVRGVAEDAACRERFSSDLQRNSRRGHLCACFSSRDRPGIGDLQDAEARAFEVEANDKILKKVLTKPRTHLALIAESPDLMEKWVHLIAAGPY